MAEIGDSSKEDRISNLPDSLLHHISSFSDMKYAVQTCILSKRWTNVWKSLPTINLDYEVHESTMLGCSDSLIRFVDKVFSLRDRSDIQRFEVSTDFMVIHCPHVYKCRFRKMRLIVSLPQLKHFIYAEDEKSDNIQLCAPNLKFLNFHGCISSDYALENLASLTSADIFMFVKENEELVPDKHWKISARKKGLYANKMMKILRELYNVKDLRLSEYILKALGGAPNLLSSHPHRLHNNLRTLKLRTWLTKGCLHSITYLLRISPHIETLSLKLFESPFDVQCRRGGYLDFDKVTYDDSGTVGNIREAWLSLPCKIDHLKLVKVHGIRGCLNELKLLEFLLANAITLEKLILTPCSRYSKQEVLTKLLEKLLVYPRASKGTIILFESE